jgi:hypothetical protein
MQPLLVKMSKWFEWLQTGERIEGQTVVIAGAPMKNPKIKIIELLPCGANC